MDHPPLAEALVAIARAMGLRGLNRGTAGNVSVRLPSEPERFLITPTGMRDDEMVAADVVAMGLDGTSQGRRAPSSEWRFHRDIYRTRADVGAVLHTHSPFATALACTRRAIPPFHYMIARFGGPDVRCAGYATFGTQALSDAALAALDGRKACLLANHGMIVVGADLRQALDLAIEFEALCEQYWRALQIGPPTLLSKAEMTEVMTRFAGYGQPRDADDPLS